MNCVAQGSLVRLAGSLPFTFRIGISHDARGVILLLLIMIMMIIMIIMMIS